MIPITLQIPTKKYKALQDIAKKMKVDYSTFIKEPMSFGCDLCPITPEVCTSQRVQTAAFNPDGSPVQYDCYGMLMRWLFWEK